jgi:hypothetical protein
MPIAPGTCAVLFGARPKEGSRSHPTLIPQSSNPNPMDTSSWRFLGPLRGMQDHWAIDVTAFSLQNSLYCSYSGWPLGDPSDAGPDLFLIRPTNPQEAGLKALACVSKSTLGVGKAGQCRHQ